MLFTSSLLGEVEVDESTILTFERGISAFEACTRFKLFHDAESPSPRVHWMQSLDHPDVLFSVVSPSELGLRYEIELTEDESALLRLEDPADLAVLLMVYKGDAPANDGHPLLAPLQANVRNPLLVNLKTRHGVQVTGLACDIVFHNRPA